MKTYPVLNQIDSLLSEAALSMVNWQMQKAGNQLEKVSRQRSNLLIEVAKYAKGYFSRDQKKRYDLLAKREAEIHMKIQELETQKAHLLFMLERTEKLREKSPVNNKKTLSNTTEKEDYDEIQKIRKDREAKKGIDKEAEQNKGPEL